MLHGAYADHLGGWLGAYANRETEFLTWLATIETMGQVLDRLVAPIYRRLQALGIEAGVPFVAAARRARHPTTGRRMALGRRPQGGISSMMDAILFSERLRIRGQPAPTKQGRAARRFIAGSDRSDQRPPVRTRRRGGCT